MKKNTHLNNKHTQKHTHTHLSYLQRTHARAYGGYRRLHDENYLWRPLFYVLLIIIGTMRFHFTPYPLCIVLTMHYRQCMRSSTFFYLFMFGSTMWLASLVSPVCILCLSMLLRPNTYTQSYTYTSMNTHTHTFRCINIVYQMGFRKRCRCIANDCKLCDVLVCVLFCSVHGALFIYFRSLFQCRRNFFQSVIRYRWRRDNAHSE